MDFVEVCCTGQLQPRCLQKQKVKPGCASVTLRPSASGPSPHLCRMPRPSARVAECALASPSDPRWFARIPHATPSGQTRLPLPFLRWCAMPGARQTQWHQTDPT